ncbi:MAG TPA: hypothetical protein VMR99_00500 [Candidatus Paceibacterota bacterium]|nr:hypothetical protein [Candidatus Paceibacterota bacterium]
MEDKLLHAIEEANKLVEKSNIKDPELKKIAFSKAVDFFLTGGPKTENQTAVRSGREVNVAGGATGEFWTDLSEAVGIDVPTLKDIYSLKDDKIYLVISRVKGSKKNDQQRYLSALIVYAYHEGMKLEWVPSNLLARAAEHSSLYNTSNFSKNISDSDWFRTDGAKKGLRYKLSALGMAEAKSYLKELSAQGNG